MQRKWYQKRSIIFTIHILIFVGFVIFYETYIFFNTIEETKNLSKLITSFVWNLDDNSAKQYLEVYIQNKNIHKIKIFHPDKSIFLEVLNTVEKSLLYNLLKKIHLIREYNLKSKIQQEKETIGELEIVWLNENIFIYFYVFIIFILLSFIAYFYVETIIQKNLLNSAYEEIKSLKIQQDADYFLTSLLIKPLSNFDIKSNFYKYEYYIEQKKKFEYKKYKEEIGGDFILVKKIQLRNRNYIFFVNADAMGKSLQGGSGILVLGSILYAILKRLEFRREDQNKSPETWLKYLALELQELYESFQGSMLISGVFGLIDEKNGLLYYINFEHPYPVIYRNGKAFFIGENYILFKIGMPRTFQQSIKIQIYELNENDIFIVGSDGKDDIEIEVNHNKYKNEDETLFLRIVEQSEGDIKLMINYLKKTGSLTDDISILSFHTIKKEIPIIDNIPANNGKEIKKRIIDLIKNKEFQKAYYVLKPYVEEYPLDTYLLYYYFVSLYQLGYVEKAIEIGEQIINRIDAPLKVYPILIKSYIKVRYYSRAESLLKEYKKISTNNLDKIQELEKILHQDKQIRTDKL